MASPLKQILLTQKEHSDTLGDHELILRGNPRTETPGMIHALTKLALKVEAHESLKNKFMWMILGASSVGTIVGVLAHIVIKELIK